MVTIKNGLHIITLLFVFGFSFAQTKINQSLKTELDGILKSDQILREYIDSETTDSRKIQILNETGYSEEALANGKVYMLLNKRDSINLIRVDEIIKQYGYPGKTLVGEPTNEAAWYVIQHSKKIAYYFPLIQEAGSSNEISFTKVAMMQDRLLTQEGKEQIYGTQGAGLNRLNPIMGKMEFWYYICPIKDEEHVNELRKEAGFTTTVEENAKRMGIEYKVYTLEDIKLITK